MKYKVAHITEYFYSDPVPLCHNVVHLMPRETSRQKRISHSLSITPHPLTLTSRQDFFGNPVTWFSLQEPHDRLRIAAVSEIEMQPFTQPTTLWSPAWEQVRQILKGRRDPDLLEAQQFTFESRYVSLGPELRAYALASFPDGKPLLECVTDLTQRIYREFTFDTRATTIGTPAVEVLKHRHGVCQDFAHLQIGCLRSIGLAARYVSGYLVTKPPPGRPRLVGCDTSHAWVSCFFPDFGWIDFDPTNGTIPSTEHITLARARDYDDLAPVRGVVVGGHRHSLAVSVDVQPLAIPAKAAAS